MSRYRHALPQLNGGLFLTDGGIETTLIFHEGFELPYFAAFDLLRHERGRRALHDYFASYAQLAARAGSGLILEAPTWRASSDWGARLGYDADALAAANLDAIALLEDVRREGGHDSGPVVISGCIGPRGDGYVVEGAMSARAAQSYHAPQIETFARSAADMVCALTMNYVEEAVGISKAAEAAGMPAAISFTVETDARLPAGSSLGDAISAVDDATGGYPAYYMINCAHPTHLAKALDDLSGADWVSRLRGLRANASARSHEELNDAPDLDSGNPEELADQYRDLLRTLPALNVLGGCCGTDERHIECIASVCGPVLGEGR